MAESGIGSKVEALRQHIAALDATGVEPQARLLLRGLQTALQEVQLAEAELFDELEAARSTAEAERQRYQQLFELAPDAYFVTDSTGLIQEANYRATELLALSAADLADRPLSTFVVPEDRAVFIRQLEEVAWSGSHGAWRAHVQGLVPPPTPVAISVSAVLDTNGTQVGLRWLMRDMSEQDRHRRAVRASEARLQAIIETAADGIIIIDEGGAIELINPAALRMFGCEREDDVLGRPIASLIPAALPDEGAAWALQDDLVGLRRDQSTFPLDVALSELRADSSRHYTAIVRDLSDRKRLEAELLQANKMEAVGRLAGGVAHDFNNLLMGIMGCSALALKKLDPSSGARPYLEEMKRAAQRGTSLTRQLLAFSHKRVPKATALRLNDVVRSAEMMLLHLFSEDVETELRLESSDGLVNADHGQLEQVLMNLAVNARDAMPEGGRVCIETADVDLSPEDARGHPDVGPGPYVTLAVTDSGIGMSPETVARVFEPFFTTKEAGVGTGLGLASVYGTVKRYNGHIHIDSRLGGGTTIRIYLPRLVQAVERSPTPAQLPQGRHETILVVEDDRLVRMAVRHYLERNGYTVLEADCGEQALELCQSTDGRIDLLLTDMVMPGMTGSDLAQQITQSNPSLRTVYMSGYPGDERWRRLRDSGVTFIEKPFDEEALADTVRRALDTPPSISAPA